MASRCNAGLAVKKTYFIYIYSQSRCWGVQQPRTRKWKNKVLLFLQVSLLGLLSLIHIGLQKFHAGQMLPNFLLARIFLYIAFVNANTHINPIIIVFIDTFENYWITCELRCCALHWQPTYSLHQMKFSCDVKVSVVLEMKTEQCNCSQNARNCILQDLRSAVTSFLSYALAK